MTRVIIIGAGWCGLVTAKTYLQVDPSIDLTVLDSEDTLGGTWAASRIYPELLTQQPFGAYEFTDMSYDPTDDPPQPGNYIPSRRVHEYMNKYAETWGVKDKIRFGVTVEQCKRAADGVKWEVYLQGEKDALVCDKLVVATGLTSQPKLPDIPSENFTPLTFHSRFLGKHYSTLQGDGIKTVCVYGGGKSGYDAVTAAVNHGKQVHWIIRDQGGGGVAAFFKPELFGRPTAENAFTPVNGIFNPNITDTTSWSYRLFHSGRSWLGSWFVWWYWAFGTRQMLGPWKYDENENMRKLKPDIMDRNIYWCPVVPYSVPDETIVDIIREGKKIIIHRAGITKLSGNKVHLSDGTTLETDMLVHATGYETNVPIFSEKDCLELGLPVRIDRLSSLDPNLQYPSAAHQQAGEWVLQKFPRLATNPIEPREPTYTQYRLYRFVTPLSLAKKDDRSLAFVGFLSGVGTAVINDVTALWAVAWLTGDIKITKSTEEIEEEVDLFNAYIRKRYVNAGRHTSLFIFEWFSILKIMLAELKVPLPQKSAWKPWLPRDYRGMVEKWMTARSLESKKAL
ncbi:FAD/NAD(P)-binding domain-containing protein [Serendipita vermifera]|nr:FAD/NAD(P)-binding domain-containing protein [Serendipita vermifera]